MNMRPQKLRFQPTLTNNTQKKTYKFEKYSFVQFFYRRSETNKSTITKPMKNAPSCRLPLLHFNFNIHIGIINRIYVHIIYNVHTHLHYLSKF